MRDSSPPEATFASGPSGCFGWLATRNSTCSLPKLAGAASFGSATSKRPPFIASSCIAWVTRFCELVGGELPLLRELGGERTKCLFGCGRLARERAGVGGFGERPQASFRLGKKFG